MTNNFFKLLWLPILINASDYYTPEAARARAEESIRRFGARYNVYNDKTSQQRNGMSNAQQAAGHKPYIADMPPFYRRQQHYGNMAYPQLRGAVGCSENTALKNMKDVYGNSCPQNMALGDLNKKITEYAYRYDLSPEAEADMKSRAGYNELMVEEMQILDQIYVDDIPEPVDEPIVCRKRGCPYYKCYRKKNCTCC